MFLSAGLPSGDHARDFRPYDVTAITEAVTAVAEAVLAAGGRILFGAHPAVSPLLLMVAGDVGRRNVVEIFQSRRFAGEVKAEALELVARGFGESHWTDRMPGRDVADDLRRMREEMIDSGPLDAAVFIGGMDGVLAEYAMVAERRPSVPLLPIRSAGGAAARLAPSGHDLARRLTPVLATPFYPVIAQDLVAGLAEVPPAASD